MLAAILDWAEIKTSRALLHQYLYLQAYQRNHLIYCC
jgi:hypothetical protein